MKESYKNFMHWLIKLVMPATRTKIRDCRGRHIFTVVSYGPAYLQTYPDVDVYTDYQDKFIHQSIEDLRKLLGQALAREDYKSAASIRDKIKHHYNQIKQI